MTIHTHTSHTIYGNAHRAVEDGYERYGTEYAHVVSDGKVYVQIDAMLLDVEALRALSIDARELQLRVDVENGVNDAERS